MKTLPRKPTWKPSKHVVSISLKPMTATLPGGDVGRGRLAEPERIVSAVLDLLNGEDEIKNDFAGKRVMVTAGPTVEPIDPVRYLTNRSSGKFGYALASAAANRGAQVTLISGPVHSKRPLA